MKTADLFEKQISPKCEKEGVEIKRCSEYHFQLKGIFLINVYPTKQSFYMQGANKKEKYKSLDQLINLSLGLSDVEEKLIKTKRTSLKSKKNELWTNCKNCFFCGERIEKIEDASIEHKIPLSRGGSNRKDNLALSHYDCNFKRGNNLKTLRA